MEYACEVVVNAVASDIVGLIISSAVDYLLRWSSAGGARDARRQHVEQLLYSIGSAAAEAEGRCITNLELLAQLKALNDARYRARFALEFTEIDDVLENAAAADDDGDDDAGDDSVVTTRTRKRKFALCSTFTRGRLIRRLLIRGGGNGDDGAATEKRLVDIVEEMEALTRNCIRDFILLVQGYPRRTEVPRPLTTTLFMDRCVFGRHVEKERIVTFLLQPPAPAVCGAWGVGKTTLVKHVCDDERVRGHFARVQWFSTGQVLRAGELSDSDTSWRTGWLEYLAGVRRILDEPRFGAVGRSLLVFDHVLPVDVEESAWPALLATSALAHARNGSKLIFACESTDRARILGTADPVVLRPVPEEEYWYYFKAFAFAGVDPRDHHPRMAAVGRDICHHLEGTFLDARVLGPLLRVNFNLSFWRRVLATTIGVKRHLAIIDVLLNLLPITTGMHLYSFGRTHTPMKVTLQDMISTSGPSSSSTSRTSCLGHHDDTEKYFTIHLYKETLYMDHWNSITFLLDNDGKFPTSP